VVLKLTFAYGREHPMVMRPTGKEKGSSRLLALKVTKDWKD
jgi:hypothetical protein